MILKRTLSLIGRISVLKMSILGLSLVGGVPSQAENLGAWGETFAIEEEDLLERILSKLRGLQNNGKLERLSTEANRRVKNMILRPSPIQGISYAETQRKYVFDPSIVVTRDLFDAQGRIFAHKGDRFNPLDNVTMRPLLFIDGENEKHVRWAVSKLSDSKIYRHDQGKIVLIKGSPLDLQKKLSREIYFDQFGLLSRKLKIKHVPAIVYQNQNDKVLTIVEDLP